MELYDSCVLPNSVIDDDIRIVALGILGLSGSLAEDRFDLSYSSSWFSQRRRPTSNCSEIPTRSNQRAQKSQKSLQSSGVVGRLAFDQ
jgi:hypothetical protein